MRTALLFLLAGGSLLAGCTANEPAPAPTPVVQKAGSCEALTGLALKGGKVDAATSLAGGAMVNLEAGKPGLPAPAAFCRVQATLSPVPGSSIKVEVWLPERAAWNGKLLGAGNGGFGANMLLAHAESAYGREALAALDFYAHAESLHDPNRGDGRCGAARGLGL